MRDELSEGVNAVAVSVEGPRGKPVAALGVSAPTQRFNAAQQAKAVATLKTLSQEISKVWADAGATAETSGE